MMSDGNISSALMNFDPDTYKQMICDLFWFSFSKVKGCDHVNLATRLHKLNSYIYSVAIVTQQLLMSIC